MTRLAHLLQPDGSVIVPADVAADILAALVRDLTASARRDGVQVSDRARRVLYALHEAAVRHDAAQPTPATGSTTDTGVAEPVSVVTVREVAEAMGCSPGYVRRLARTGRLAGRRTGHGWLIDETSFDRYRHRREP